ncbi:MAG: GNAT family N-acetyltransferase [Microthrixaceae bacterium]|nr:GNAT family N-acetyltransferase [Microthrixaceae bacterium]
MSSEISIRRAEPSDRQDAIDLCRAALGWGADDPNEAFFDWKHFQNPFGESPMWLAEMDGRLVGVRVFLRWRFVRNGQWYEAVRAVDTATHPDAQGRGVFKALTLGALPELTEAGTHFVFNTPNAQSRPGYLKMGWSEVGRVPVGVAIVRPGALRRVAGAKAAANKWSEPLTIGLTSHEAFANEADVEALIGDQRSGEFRTDRSGEYLRWRYSFEALQYRVVPVGDRISDGVVVVRIRRRGSALEATISEVLAASPKAFGATMRRILRETGADYAIAGGGTELARSGFVSVPRLGPILTWRPLGRPGVPLLNELDLELGDVELF